MCSWVLPELGKSIVLRTVPRENLVPACWWDFSKDSPIREVLAQSDGGRFMRDKLGIGAAADGRDATATAAADRGDGVSAAAAPASAPAAALGRAREVVPGEWQAWCNWAEKMHL